MTQRSIRLDVMFRAKFPVARPTDRAMKRRGLVERAEPHARRADFLSGDRFETTEGFLGGCDSRKAGRAAVDRRRNARSCFCATRGLAFIERSSLTKSSAS